MKVLGAGMAGLLAAAMLREECTGLFEAQDALPSNHHAVLRFRSSVVGDVLNIPFKKVKALKTTDFWMNPLAAAMAYSKKTNGGYSMRSIAGAYQPELVDRWVAPRDFISKMAGKVSAPIRFGRKMATLADLAELGGEPIISTLPMKLLMGLLQWPDLMEAEFKSFKGWSITATLPDCDMYASLYVPNPNYGPSRISITGSSIIIEVVDVDGIKPDPTTWIRQAADLLAIPAGRITDINVHEQKFMKILPMDEQVRTRFIMWATEKYNIYSLGRFATWRPGLLLDDVVNDVRVIQRIQSSNSYHHKLRSQP